MNKIFDTNGKIGQMLRTRRDKIPLKITGCMRSLSESVTKYMCEKQTEK